MMPEERFKIISEDYVDFIAKYNGDPISLAQYQQYTVQTTSEMFAMVYIPVSQLSSNFVAQYGYSGLPHCYGLCSAQSLEASGIVRLRRSPTLNLLGKGVIVGIIDTGIDYTNPVFIKSNGTSKVLSIWDQTIAAGTTPPGADFGSEYNNQQINQALASEDPFEIVPSIDEIGHGTMLAGVAAGNKVPGAGFAGVVPESDLIIVKLRQAKDYLRDFFIVPKDIPCYQENHNMWGVQ